MYDLSPRTYQRFLRTNRFTITIDEIKLQKNSYTYYEVVLNVLTDRHDIFNENTFIKTKLLICVGDFNFGSMHSAHFVTKPLKYFR